MEANYWLTRQKEEAAMASGAASTEARLVHYELARRYGEKANQAEMDTLAFWEIQRIPADRYWVDGVCYTNPGDAIAEARRRAAQ